MLSSEDEHENDNSTRPPRLLFISMTVMVVIGLCYGTARAYTRGTAIPALVAEETRVVSKDELPTAYNPEDDSLDDNYGVSEEGDSSSESIVLFEAKESEKTTITSFLQLHWKTILICMGVAILLVSTITMSLLYYAHPTTLLYSQYS